MNSKPLGDARRGLVEALQVVGDKWTLLLVHDMARGLRHYEDLQTSTGMPRSTLAARLKDLEAHGLLERARYLDRPPRHEYRLTEKGRDLWAAAVALSDWGNRWSAPGDGTADAKATPFESGKRRSVLQVLK